MIIGVDAGTSMVKAVAFSTEGEALAVESRRARLHYPGPDRAEQDLDEIVAATGEVVRGVAARSGEVPDAIGLTGQGDGLWLLDEQGYPIRPGISWLDARAGYVVEEWISSGVFEAVFRRSGNVIFPGSQAPLLAALQREEPGSLERAATAAYCKDAILQRLTGERATDASDASLPFLDVRTRRYDEDLLKLCGLEQWRDLLAPVDPAPGPMRLLNDEGAKLTGLPEGTPVHGGPFDLSASALGAGLFRPGEGLIILGTTLACEVLTDRVETGGEPGGLTLCTIEPDRWLRAMPAMVGTASLDWLLSFIGAKHEDIERFLEESGPGARGVEALPFFSASGERAPFVAPMARGQISGLTLGTEPADVVRALCESIGYAARHCLEAAGLDGEVSICGGGSESRAWRQVLADVLGSSLKISRRPEVGARGAAMAAMTAMGTDFDHAAWTRPEGYVEPRPEMAEHYEKGFSRYLTRVEAARALWDGPPRHGVSP
jgi:erythritol kinase